jgi:hypothetical protein
MIYETFPFKKDLRPEGIISTLVHCERIGPEEKDISLVSIS